MASTSRKGTLAGVLAQLRIVILVLTLSGCGFSGALYLPDEPPPPDGASQPSEASPA